MEDRKVFVFNNKLSQKRYLGRFIFRREDNIRMGSIDMVVNMINWLDLMHGRDHY